MTSCYYKIKVKDNETDISHRIQSTLRNNLQREVEAEIIGTEEE